MRINLAKTQLVGGILSVAVLLFIGSHIKNSPQVICIQPVTNIPDTINDPFDFAYVEDHLGTLDQKDPQLIKYTRMKYLTPPSKLPYRLDNPSSHHRDIYSDWILNFFKNKRGGMFIEAGAHDGEGRSHTLYLEKELGWTGLLVECNPSLVPFLKTKHRKAWIAEVCLSPTNTPGTLNFSIPMKKEEGESSYAGTLGKGYVWIRQEQQGNVLNWTHFEVQTIPLYTVLAALEWKEVDYFSFDIEAQELNLLRNFPFDLVRFKVLIVEVHLYNDQEKAELNQLLKSKGYVFVMDMDIDKIYVHKNFESMIPPVVSRN